MHMESANDGNNSETEASLFLKRELVLIKVVWDLTKPLPKQRANRRVLVKPVGRDQLEEVGKILVRTWGGFIQNPRVTIDYLGPYVDAGVEQPFIAYLDGKPVGCVSPRLDRESKLGVLDGGVHVLQEHRRRRIGTALLLAALGWLKDNGMREAWVTPNNPESEEATRRAEAFYLATGGRPDGKRKANRTLKRVARHGPSG